ncbi:MAG: glycosyl transferase [Legionellales bacterium RIFCSPHIGHO2_12_FULL_37_14]|nr:MAG: glycosyl transferase [Legionellales bacterium RIFCSPHIGHO2_12_FULL_37_14]
MQVSIITPSYNQGPYFLRTLESVQQQINGVNLEHIVFDGASTDNTLEILAQYASSNPHLKWTSEKDKGQAHAVNKGILLSKGEIIGWINSDDIYYKDAIKNVLEVFKANKEVDVVYGMADHIDKNDIILEEYPSEKWDEKRLLETCYICQPTLFLRRRVIDKCGLLDENLQYCMDYEYWLRLNDHGIKFYYLEKKLAGSRFYEETKTLGARAKVHHEICQMFKSKYNYVPAKWIVNNAFAVIEGKMNKKMYPRLFLVLILMHSVYGNIRWNKSISNQYFKLILYGLRRKFG